MSHIEIKFVKKTDGEEGTCRFLKGFADFFLFFPLTSPNLLMCCRVKNTWHAFNTIVKEGGVRGLWKGWVPNVQRAALVNLGGTRMLLSRFRYLFFCKYMYNVLNTFVDLKMEIYHL